MIWSVGSFLPPVETAADDLTERSVSGTCFLIDHPSPESGVHIDYVALAAHLFSAVAAIQDVAQR